mgnify:CR=1 FL=1
MDLDRTLLHTDKTLSAYTVKVLKKCQKRGINIMVATARPERETKQYSDLIDFDAMVASNGARIIYKNQRANYGICPQSAERLLNALNRYPNLRITVETGDCAYSNYPIEDYETVLSLGLMNAVEKYRENLKKQAEAEAASVSEEDKPIVELVNKRTEAKKAKNFALADSIRDQLKDMGIVVEDTPQGPKWKRI